MKVITNKENSKLLISIEGRIDTMTAPELSQQVNDNIDGITDLTMDFEKVEYISSAGLRVLLGVQKIMNRQGKMVLKNVCDGIKEIFDITGFTDILTIE